MDIEVWRGRQRPLPLERERREARRRTFWRESEWAAWSIPTGMEVIVSPGEQKGAQRLWRAAEGREGREGVSRGERLSMHVLNIIHALSIILSI